MTSSPHGPYDQGFTRHTMVGTEGSQAARWSQSHKTDRSPDCTLQLECMKSESLVIAGQHTAVNTFPGLVHTARHTMGVGDTRSRQNNRKEFAYHGMLHDWGEVVTRQPQGNLRLDHLLSREKKRLLGTHTYRYTELRCEEQECEEQKNRDDLMGLQLRWLEHTLDKRGVVGSSPTRPTKT